MASNSRNCSPQSLGKGSTLDTTHLHTATQSLLSVVATFITLTVNFFGKISVLCGLLVKCKRTLMQCHNLLIEQSLL